MYKESEGWVRVDFCALWEDIMLESRALYNENTGEIEVIDKYGVEKMDLLNDQFIRMPNGDEKKVKLDDENRIVVYE